MGSADRRPPRPDLRQLIGAGTLRTRGARLRGVTAGLALGLSVAGGPPGARASEVPILPIQAHTSPELRTLAEAHAEELGRLLASLGRCHPGLAVQRHGIAFRRPLGPAAAAPHLTLWVWVDAGVAPDLAGRAAQTFRRHGRALVRELVGRGPVFQDVRVSGYGLILSWRGAAGDGPVIGESLVVFADKLAAASFAHDTISVPEFLARADVRGFQGQTPLPPLRLQALDDDGVPEARAAC